MKVAIVGAGQIADAHIGEVGKIESATIVALCDLFESSLQALQDKYQIPRVFTDYDAMLRETSPDVVHLATPPGTHLMLARKAIEAGASVYIEKPLTVTYSETEELLACAAAHGKHVCIGTNHLCSKAQKMATQKIRNGELGGITHIDTFFSYDLQGIFGRQVLANPDHWIAKLPGQIFQNNLNHSLAPILPYLSDNYSVQSWADAWSDNGVVFEELRVFIVDHDNQFTTNIVFSSNVKPAAFRIAYYGRKKALFLNNYNHTMIEDVPTSVPGTLGQILAIRKSAKELLAQFRHGLLDFFLGRRTYFTDMKELFEAFYAAIDGKGPLPVSPDELRKAAKIMDMVFAQIGRPDAKN